MLLRRYGVVFREVLARETILPKWREVLIALRRLEDRGEISWRAIRKWIHLASNSRCRLLSNRCAPSAHVQGVVCAKVRAYLGGIRRADPLSTSWVSSFPADRVSANSGKRMSFPRWRRADRAGGKRAPDDRRR